MYPVDVLPSPIFRAGGGNAFVIDFAYQCISTFDFSDQVKDFLGELKTCKRSAAIGYDVLKREEVLAKKGLVVI